MKLSTTVLPFAVAAALVASVTVRAADAVPSGIDQTAFDPTVRAQDDLFLHVNGGWMKRTEIPPDRSRFGIFNTIQDQTLEHLRGLVEASAANPGGTADQKKIGALYGSFMDEAALEKLGAKPLASELQTIDAVRTPADMAAEMAHLVRIGATMPIELSVGQDDRDSTRYVPFISQGGLGLPDRDYYLKTDDTTFAGVRSKYVDYMAILLTLSGQKDQFATATAILAFETEVARAQWSKVELRDPVKAYNKVAIADLPQLASTFDWAAYMAASGVTGPALKTDKVADVVVGQPTFITSYAKLAQATPLPIWKSYAKVRLLSSYAAYMDKAFVDARFAFAGTVLRGTTQNLPRWRRGVELVNGSIGEGLGREYVAKYFLPSSKAKMEALVANLLTAYRQSIATLDWMGPETKKQAYLKLDKIMLKIGYPETFRDYGALTLTRDDLVGNVRRAREFEYDRGLAKLGKPIDRGEWGMTPQTINAYYNPGMNEIVFPAAILQSPIFGPASDDAVNYGAIGAVIGHEISHGFDDQGAQYDADGNLREWWTADDKKRFEEKTKALVAQYNAFSPISGYNVNGELTLGENIADNSGLEIAYKAYKISLSAKPAPVLNGMSGDERFFYGFAQAWRGKQRPQALLEQIKADPHSPEEYRTNGTVRNHPAFYTTFNVKPGDEMYLAPDKRVSIW